MNALKRDIIRNLPLLTIISAISVFCIVIVYCPTCPTSDPKRSELIDRLKNLSSACLAYEKDLDFMPISLTELWRNETNEPGWKGPYIKNPEILKDPWGHPFVLLLVQREDHTAYGFKIYTYPRKTPKGQMNNTSWDVKFYNYKPELKKQYLTTPPDLSNEYND
ncbi:MAG: type II secretion system protein GspG [Candidatus Wallbacteria bacterium]|nr:type II secretion system protein GspG [Candidatus Wallbacteria bacterium]